MLSSAALLLCPPVSITVREQASVVQGTPFLVRAGYRLMSDDGEHSRFVINVDSITPRGVVLSAVTRNSADQPSEAATLVIPYDCTARFTNDALNLHFEMTAKPGKDPSTAFISITAMSSAPAVNDTAETSGRMRI